MLLTRKTTLRQRELAMRAVNLPQMAAVTDWMEFETGVMGLPDPQTGFLLNIVTIDEAVRALVPPIFAEAKHAGSGFFETLRSAAHAVDASLSSDIRVHLAYFTCDIHPNLRVTCACNPSPSSKNQASAMPPLNFEITASYEFAASHRLHCATRTEEENRRIFGKCNNPNGHGHNYRIEVHCAVTREDETAFAALDAAVENEIMRRFDHRHLNLDCPEFANLNPTVENIAMVCFNYLEKALAHAGLTARSVRVYETPRTSAIYPSGA